VVDLSNVSLSDLAAATGDVDFGDNKAVNVADPDANQDAATKKYHDDHKYTDTEAVAAVEDEADLALKLFGSATQPRVWVYRGSDQTIPTGVYTVITWLNSYYNVGPGTNLMWSSTTNPSRLTVKVAGLYLLYGFVRFYSNTIGRRIGEIRENGSTILVATEGLPSGSAYFTLTMTCLHTLAVNDYVELRVWQTSGGNLNTHGPSRSMGFMAVRLY